MTPVPAKKPKSSRPGPRFITPKDAAEIVRLQERRNAINRLREVAGEYGPEPVKRGAKKRAKARKR